MGLGLGGFSLSSPGPGAFPTLIGSSLIVLAGPLVYPWLRRRSAVDRSAPLLPLRSALYLASVIAYTFLLHYIPFFIATPAFILVTMVLLRASHPEDSVSTVRLFIEWGVLALVLTITCYLVFETMLQVALP